MTTLRLWLLRALTALLAFAFAMPSCTVVLWRDNRSIALTDVSQPPELRAFRLMNEPGSLVLQLPPATAQALRDHVPELPANVEWVALRPRNADAAPKLDAACKPDARWPVRVAVFRAAPESPFVWTFEPSLAVAMPFGGVDHRARMEDAACDAAMLAGAPNDLGDPIPAVALDYATMNDDGTSVPVRIALTPLAVAADAVAVTVAAVAIVVMIPLLPIAWVIHEIGGDE